jgi:hypothetical protein
MNPTTSNPVFHDQQAADAICLNACLPFDRLEVRTQRTVYDVVVLRGSTGDALVRGGQYFTEFRRARVVGSTYGGSAVRLRTIEVGAQLELQVAGQRVVTSTIQAVSPIVASHEGAPLG